MVLIVGLGNPGNKYANSRHNVGFMAVDSILKKLGKVEESVWREEKSFKCEIARVGWGNTGNRGDWGETKTEIVFVKPQTFMNASGTAVAKVLNFYKIVPLNLFVIHDEIDFPLGKVKVVVNRGAAGHHGVESIIREVGTMNFVRVRVGIGREGDRGIRWIRGIREIWGKRGRATEDYVLKPFGRNEEGKLSDAIKRTVDIMEMILKEGVERAMAKFN